MSEATRIPELFGSLVFNERTMEQYVPQSAMDVWRGCLKSGQPLPLSAANEIADAMKTWALEHGATHFTHWFQPLSGVTAEKHDSFINNAGGGRVMMDFSGKELVRGEPDASSFPNGGLRATFEARGYSAWDPTAFAFIKDGSLCIPTVFCSYSGDALDKKTPLLRSMAAVDRAAVRVLKLFGDDAEKVTPQIGAEQEYFLIDRELYLKRMDLRLCGRALFGAKPPKGQELDDHYFGAFRPRVAAYMKELDEELWKLGVLSKTKHNEVAPGQHEMAPIYTDANTASDQNQLVMETMKKVAERHNLVCLLHEKPFAGVNGSGKHVNWSLSTDTGKNLFSPGKTPSQNAVFLLVLAAFIKGVDEYQELLRCSVAFAGNDHRLGAQEAPPAVISVFLGTELEGIIDAIVGENDYTAPEHKSLRIGVDVLPAIPQDTTDRNRTSPLAFTLLTVVGAAYLLYLAWLSFRAGASMAHLQESRFLGYWGLYRRGVIMNITNPKVTLFFLAFLPQFCAPERGSVALQVMELGLLFMLAAFLVFTAVSALGGRLAHWFNSSPRGQMLMHRVAGLVFVALAVMLIFSCVA